MKKINILVLIALFLFSNVNQAFANSSLGSVSRTTNFNQKYQEIEVYLSPEVDRVTLQLDKRDFGGRLEQPIDILGEPNSFITFRIYCAADVIFGWNRINYYPPDGSFQHTQTVRVTKQFVNDCMCDKAKFGISEGWQYKYNSNDFSWLYLNEFSSCGYDGSEGNGGNGNGGNEENGEVTFDWPKDDNATSYEIIRDGKVIGTVSGSNTTFTDSSAKIGGTYNYQVVPVYGNGSKGSPINVGSVTVPPGGKVTIPGGSGGGNNGKVTFGWNHVSSGSKGKPTSYKVVKDGKVIDTIPGTNNSYSDSSAKVGETHDYKVIPVYEDGSEGDAIEIGKVEVKDKEEIIIPGGSVTAKCDPCKVFECPGWQQYMNKLDQIKNAIPPAPNWKEVADTFKDAIVPNLVNEVGDLLGTAPEPPATPPQLPGLDDKGIKSKEPVMQDVPGLKEAGFDANKIKNQAPVIQERSDPTGGFDLTKNPMDTLPKAPENPKPGQTDPGEWGKNKPKEEANPFPFPQDTGEPNVGTPPKPNDNGAKPPTPGGDPGSAPKPGGDLGNAPTLGGTGGDAGMKDYKPNPNAPDGSGGDLGL